MTEFILTPEIERQQDQVCIDFWDRKIDSRTAKQRLVSLGLDPDICDEGLIETKQRRERGLPMTQTPGELN